MRNAFAFLAVLLALLIAVGPASASIELSVQPGSTRVLPLPLVSEAFTLLPCNRQTTIGMEGCSEHQIVQLDKQLSQGAALIYRYLEDNTARNDLVSAQKAWLSYRHADCLSESDVFQGGSEASVEFGLCEVTSDKTRLADLAGFWSTLTEGRSKGLPVFP